MGQVVSSVALFAGIPIRTGRASGGISYAPAPTLAVRMRLRSLRLLSFRAHDETDVTFAPGVNLIYGPNGSGKTNLLEAIHYLCLSKSFLTSQDPHALRQGCPFFEVEGRFEGEQRPEFTARLVYVPEEGKRIFVNKAPLERLSEVVGMLPVVVFSPADGALTAGGPDERRKFLDNTLSQARPVYLDDLLKYRRALKQRNALLLRAAPLALARGPRLAAGVGRGADRARRADHRAASALHRRVRRVSGRGVRTAWKPSASGRALRTRRRSRWRRG